MLSINEKITVVVLEGDKAGAYPSRIEDVGSDAIVVAAPTNEGAVLELAEGDRVQVGVLQKDALYTFSSSVEAVIRRPFPMLQLALPARIERHQRRRYARVDSALPVRYRRADTASGPRMVPYRAMATNVSGGGALIATRDVHPGVDPGSLVEVELELPEGRVYAAGQVVRVLTEAEGQEVRFKVAVEFTEIDERDRDALVRYVLKRQFELRRKGLL